MDDPEDVGLALVGREDFVGVAAGEFGPGPLAARLPSFPLTALEPVDFTVCARAGLEFWTVASTMGSAVGCG